MPIQAYVLIQVNGEKIKEAVDRIARTPGVVKTELVTGNYDVVALTEGADLKALGDTVISKIRRIEGVSHTSSLVVVPT